MLHEELHEIRKGGARITGMALHPIITLPASPKSQHRQPCPQPFLSSMLLYAYRAATNGL